MTALYLYLTLLLLLFSAGPRPEGPPVISAENLPHLRSVARIDFAAGTDAFVSGSFVMDEKGGAIAAVDAENSVHVWDAAGEPLWRDPLTEEVFALDFAAPDILLLARWRAVDLLQVSYVNVVPVDGQYAGNYELLPNITDPPVALWAGHGPARGIWLELIAEPSYLLHFTPDADEPSRHPYLPALDETAVVRIGRIPLPYAVTSSLSGQVRLWDIEAGLLLHEADSGTGQPAVFGHINTAATHLAWRDPASQDLYLLDFTTGQNQHVAPLDGDYMQYMFLTPAADLVLAVSLGYSPHVFAWEVDSGRQHDLGPYRDCGRVPDMARLSADGTTLVIGCDTGLDIWRVALPDED